MTENMWDIDLGNSSIAVAIGDNGSIYTSTDGASSCTKRTSGTTVEFNELIYGNGTFVASGVSGTVLTSSDGISWTSRTSGTTNALYGGTYTASNVDGVKEFALVGGFGTILSSKDDGASWTTISLTNLTTGTIWGIARGGTTWVVTGSSGYISTISDCESELTTRTSGPTETLRRVFYKE